MVRFIIRIQKFITITLLVLGILSSCEPLSAASLWPRHLYTLKTPGVYSEVQSCLFSPDGKTLYVASTGYAEGGGSLTVWSTRTGRLQKTLLRRSVGRIVRSPDGRTLVSDDAVETAQAERRDMLRVWDTRTWRLRHSLDMTNIRGFALSPSGRWLALGIYRGRKGVVQLRDMKRWRVVQTLQSDFELAPIQIAFSPNGTVIAATTLYSDAGWGELQVWKRATGQTIYHEDETYWEPLLFLPDGHTLIVGKNRLDLRRPHRPSVRIFKSDKPLDRWTRGQFHPGSNICTFNLYDERVDRYTALELWDVKRQTRVAHWPRSSYGGKGLAFSNDGALMAEWAGEGNRGDLSRFVRVHRLVRSRVGRAKHKRGL